jgi:hypothetical protein
MIFIGSVKILGRWKIKVFEGARRAGRFSFGGSAMWLWGWSAPAAGRDISAGKYRVNHFLDRGNYAGISGRDRKFLWML